ncbi:MAG: class I SAM-dependent RNA methyltransferase [Bacteroidia bacterium]
MNFDTSGIFNMVAKTQFGLEEILAGELEALGATNLETHNRAVSFSGDKAVMYKANLYSRTALKILVPLEKFKAKNDKDLYEEVRRINWDKYLDVNDTFAIDGILKSEYFNHSQYIALKTKDAIADWFREKFDMRPSVDVINPTLRLNLHINQDDCTLSLDSSNESLHRRGYRGESTIAPLNEVTAAGLILLTGWNGKGNFVDPMCGSGTILIEAAMIAKNIPANYLRKQFGFETWKDFDSKLWKHIKEEAKANIRKSEAVFTGSDSVFKVIDIARANIARANLSDDIKVSNIRFEEMKPPVDGGIMVMNPPYGERLEVEEINAFYKMIGDKLKKDYKGYDAWIFSSNKEALKKIGLQASKKFMLFNGPLECKFHRYSIYEGTRDPKKLQKQISSE